MSLAAGIRKAMAPIPCTASQFWSAEAQQVNRRILHYLTLALLLSGSDVALAQAGPAPRELESPEMFPAGPYREETFYFCSACHGFKLIAQQGMSREKWDETLAWMTVKHNMPKVEGKDLDQMLDYLATAFPAKAPSQTGGWKNPFAP
jgi:hypothetical protein